MGGASIRCGGAPPGARGGGSGSEAPAHQAQRPIRSGRQSAGFQITANSSDGAD